MKFREKNKKSNDDPFPLQSEKGWKKVVKIYHHYTNLLMPNDPDFSNYKKTHIKTVLLHEANKEQTNREQI